MNIVSGIGQPKRETDGLTDKQRDAVYVRMMFNCSYIPNNMK